MRSFEELVVPGVDGLLPYIPGRPIEMRDNHAFSKVRNLASNENVLGASKNVKQAVAKAAKNLHYYPDGGAYALRGALAKHYSIDTDRLIIGNGSDDILEMLAQCFLSTNRSAVFSKHAFVVYALATQRCGATSLIADAHNWGHDLDAMLEMVREDTRLVFIANPNNPTGSWINHDQLQEFLRAVSPDVLVVVDEAYYEYVAEKSYPNCLALQKQFRNLIVARTFSKIYGLAGLRVGYSIADPEIIGIMNRVRHPFNVNYIAQVAAIAALEDQKHVHHSYEMNIAGLKQISDALKDLNVEVLPSVANFMCFAAPLPLTEEELYRQLLTYGVVIRPVGRVYDMPSYLRVTVGTHADNKAFIRALKQCLDNAV